MNKNGRAGILFHQKEADFEVFFDEIKRIGFDYVVTVQNVLETGNFKSTADRYGIPVYVDFPVFFNRSFLEKNPGYYAVTDKGEKATESWSHFVCPSRDDYFDMKLNELRNIILKYRVEGVYLDFIRFFVFWENIFESTDIENIPDTCYCESCLKNFSKYSGYGFSSKNGDIAMTAGKIRNGYLREWTEWKCSLIARKLKSIREMIREADENVFLASHLIPWRKNDFKGALESRVGQSVEMMSEHLDYISPMLYSPMLKRDFLWLKSVLSEFAARKARSCGLIATIQANKCYREPEVSGEEFERILENSLSEPSEGIMIFNWEGLMRDDEKKEILRKTLSSK